MTVRNAVPRFGIRWAVVLAAVAAVVIAALLAVGSPASAQSSDDKEIWSATMTTGSFPIGQGFRHPNNGGIGSLSDGRVPLDTGNELVTLVLDSSATIGTSAGTLIFAINEQLNSDEELTWTLHVDGRTFDFNDATYSFDSTFSDVYSWPLTPRFGWATSDTVALKITEKKSISVEGGFAASGQIVEYGGNNNAAESTAIFWFTRTGNTDEALTFSFKHVQSGETATRTFKAGQSEFFNAHWAVDVDESNNPVCLITWEILSPVPGYILNLNPAFALVEGPGTTCMGTM